MQGKQLISRDSAVLPRKMDWMVTERAEDLKALMHDNATFIQFPPYRQLYQRNHGYW